MFLSSLAKVLHSTKKLCFLAKALKKFFSSQLILFSSQKVWEQNAKFLRGNAKVLQENPEVQWNKNVLQQNILGYACYHGSLRKGTRYCVPIVSTRGCSASSHSKGNILVYACLVPREGEWDTMSSCGHYRDAVRVPIRRETQSFMGQWKRLWENANILWKNPKDLRGTHMFWEKTQ